MTNAEAIRWLQLDIDMMKFDPSTGEEAYLNDDAKKTIEALDMAIEALSSGEDTSVPATDDLISRQAAIDATWEDPTYTDPLNVLTEVRDRIKALPPAQPDAIPVEWIQEYADDWEDVNYGYENPILGLLEDWRGEE